MITFDCTMDELKLISGIPEGYYGPVIAGAQFLSIVNHPRELLLSADLPIKVVCVQVGYPGITHFITAFRRRFDYTPDHYGENN